jgi:hypothetical protein
MDNLLIVLCVTGVFLLLNEMIRAITTVHFELNEINSKLDCDISNRGISLVSAGKLDDQEDVEIAMKLTSPGLFRISHSRSKTENDAIKIHDGSYEWRINVPINNLGKIFRIQILEHESDVHMSVTVRSDNLNLFWINVIGTFKPIMWRTIRLSIIFFMAIVGAIVTAV